MAYNTRHNTRNKVKETGYFGFPNLNANNAETYWRMNRITRSQMIQVKQYEFAKEYEANYAR